MKPTETIEQLAHRIGNQVRHEYEGEDVNQAFIDVEILRRCLSELGKQQEPVATLHDDGCFTWKNDELRLQYDRERAGWRMDVYANAAIPQPAAVPEFQIGDRVRTTDSFKFEGKVSQIDESQIKAFTVVNDEGQGGRFGAWELKLLSAAPVPPSQEPWELHDRPCESGQALLDKCVKSTVSASKEVKDE